MLYSPGILYASDHLLTEPEKTTKKTNASLISYIQEEVARLGINCSGLDQKKICTVLNQNGTSLKHPLNINYRNETSTIYIYFDKIIKIPTGQKKQTLFYQNLLILNSQMVGSKLEFLTKDQSIRLSTTINTDTNFDRKAFRSVIKGLITTLPLVIKKIETELSSIKTGQSL